MKMTSEMLSTERSVEYGSVVFLSSYAKYYEKCFEASSDKEIHFVDALTCSKKISSSVSNRNGLFRFGARVNRRQGNLAMEGTVLASDRDTPDRPDADFPIAQRRAGLTARRASAGAAVGSSKRLRAGWTC